MRILVNFTKINTPEILLSGLFAKNNTRQKLCEKLRIVIRINMSFLVKMWFACSFYLIYSFVHRSKTQKFEIFKDKNANRNGSQKLIPAKYVYESDSRRQFIINKHTPKLVHPRYILIVSLCQCFVYVALTLKPSAFLVTVVTNLWFNTTLARFDMGHII